MPAPTPEDFHSDDRGAAVGGRALLEGELTLRTGLPGAVAMRPLTTADAEAFAEHVAGDLEHLGEHLPWPAVTNTPDGAASWVGSYERQEDGRVVIGGVWHEGRLIGGALLFHHEPDARNIEIGCWVTAAGEGHGVAAAACRAMLAIARGKLRSERIEWRATTGNARSRRLAERLGFRHDGTLRSNYLLRGERLDTDVLSLVGEEIDTALRAH
jgi:ribosomal-protein-serine acetyltransferase